MRPTVNHLARGKPDVRETQADGLREWALVQSLPTIAVGDFRFDFSFVSESRDLGVCGDAS